MTRFHETQLRITAVLIILFLSAAGIYSQVTGQTGSNRVSLPNGWHLSPVGKMLPAGDLPLNIAISPTGKLAAVTNNGQSDQSIQLINVKKGVVTDVVRDWQIMAGTGIFR